MCAYVNELGPRFVASVARPENDLDDRVDCATCTYREVAEVVEHLHAAQAQKKKQLGHPIGFAGDKVTQRGNWVEIKFMQHLCSETGLACIPVGTKHRCSLYQAHAAPPTSKVGDREGGAAWWE